MTDPITYAKVDGPPEDWRDLRVFDLDTGAEVREVIEVNAAEGWLLRYKLNAEGKLFIDPEKPDEAASERLTGRFEIRRAA